MSYPVCIVQIHGAEEQWTLTADGSDQDPYGPSPATDLLSCRTEKHLSYARPSGHFSLTLVHRPDKFGRTWADRLQPQDLVIISMLNHGQELGNQAQGQPHTVMIGLIDTITLAVGVDSSGIPSRQITVRGEDFGKLFQRGNVTYWSFAGSTILGAVKFIEQHQLNALPHVVVKRLLDQLFFRFMKPAWTYNNSTVEFEDILGYALTSYQALFPGGLDWQFIQAEESFWSFFVKVASPPFHEVYIDTRRGSDMGQESTFNPIAARVIKDPDRVFLFSPEGEPLMEARRYDVPADSLIHRPKIKYGLDESSPYLIFRPPPFPALLPDKVVNMEAWTNLRQHVLSADTGLESQSHTISKSDAEQFNLYLVFPRGGILTEFQYLMMVPPIIDEPKFHKYGYRPLMPHCSLLNSPDSTSGDDPWLGFYKELAWSLAGWTVMNDRFWSGTKNLPLAPHIHIGERLLDKSTWQHAIGSQPSGMEFYIEFVKHDFVTHQRGRTTLGVTRGLLENEATAYASVLGLAAQDLEDVKGMDVRGFYERLVGKGQEAPT